MIVIAIKDMSDGNEETGEAWQETKIFSGTDTLERVMAWVVTRERRVQLTVPEGEKILLESEIPF